MPSELSIQKAAQVWCRPELSQKVMDTELANGFAEALDEIWSKPWLGNATTGELLDEIRARIGEGGLTYRTVDSD